MKIKNSSQEYKVLYKLFPFRNPTEQFCHSCYYSSNKNLRDRQVYCTRPSHLDKLHIDHILEIMWEEDP